MIEAEGFDTLVIEGVDTERDVNLGDIGLTSEGPSGVDKEAAGDVALAN